jgi:D-threo-aldose 1-dehydrogenase
VATRYCLDLVATALQFSLAPDVASSLVDGTAKVEHILTDHAALRAKIPMAFREELRGGSILHPEAALPA